MHQSKYVGTVYKAEVWGTWRTGGFRGEGLHEVLKYPMQIFTLCWLEC